MRTGKDPKVLVAVAGTTRAWELCWDGFASNVLDDFVSEPDVDDFEDDDAGELLDEEPRLSLR